MRKRDRILIGAGAFLILLAVIIGVTWMARQDTAADPKGKNERESAASASTEEGKIARKRRSRRAERSRSPAASAARRRNTISPMWRRLSHRRTSSD